MMALLQFCFATVIVTGILLPRQDSLFRLPAVHSLSADCYLRRIHALPLSLPPQTQVLFDKHELVTHSTLALKLRRSKASAQLYYGVGINAWWS